MRTPIVAGNWKMYKSVAEAVQYVAAFSPMVRHVTGVQIVLAPAFTALHATADAARGTWIGIAAQDIHWADEGAFTGEVSGPMAREAGATYVIVGHSERRALFGDTDADVNRKVMAAVTAGLAPIVCIGETLEQRDGGDTLDVLDRQLALGLDGLAGRQAAHLIVAYEPVWAIGTGRTATPQQASEAHGHIRRRLREQFGGEAADGCRILYGGSVKPGNIAELAGMPDVDGALVGGASLDPAAFFEIVSRSRAAAV